MSAGGYRGSSARIVMGNRPVVPATHVPEELVMQAQVVLQGKSRHVIIRELQKTVSEPGGGNRRVSPVDDKFLDPAKCRAVEEHFGT